MNQTLPEFMFDPRRRPEDSTSAPILTMSQTKTRLVRTPRLTRRPKNI